MSKSNVTPPQNLLKYTNVRPPHQYILSLTKNKLLHAYIDIIYYSGIDL